MRMTAGSCHDGDARCKNIEIPRFKVYGNVRFYKQFSGRPNPFCTVADRPRGILSGTFFSRITFIGRGCCMKAGIRIRCAVSETQADVLHERLSAMPFKVTYQEEQHGASLIAVIGCTYSQEKSVRDILNDLGIQPEPATEEDDI